MRRTPLLLALVCLLCLSARPVLAGPIAEQAEEVRGIDEMRVIPLPEPVNRVALFPR